MTLARPAPKLDPLELSTRARRGELSPAERQELERALDANVTLRIAHQVGRDFDAALRIRPGDEAVLERATKAALGHGAARPRRRKPFVAVLGLAAALVLGSAGAAVRHGWKPLGASFETLRSALAWSHDEPAAAPASRAKSARTRPNARASMTATAAASSMEVAANGALEATTSEATNGPASGGSEATANNGPEAPSSAPSSVRAAEGVRVATTPPRSGIETTNAVSQRSAIETTDAASLFRAAAAARHAGDLELAKRLYATLQTNFPHAEEAHVACVSLGKLWLAGGEARRAESEFARYLATGGGALVEEALVGRAQSFAVLGERGEERRTWLELLAKFGSGVYAERARQRLGELSAADHPAP